MSHLTTDVTLSCEVQYTLASKGRPATGPTYSCGGEPAEPPEFDIQVFSNGLDITAAVDDEQLDEIRSQVEEDYEADEGPDFEPDAFDDSD